MQADFVATREGLALVSLVALAMVALVALAMVALALAALVLAGSDGVVVGTSAGFVARFTVVAVGGWLTLFVGVARKSAGAGSVATSSCCPVKASNALCATNPMAKAAAIARTATNRRTLDGCGATGKLGAVVRFMLWLPVSSLSDHSAVVASSDRALRS